MTVFVRNVMSVKTIMAAFAAIIGGCNGLATPTTAGSSSSMWHILGAQEPSASFKTIFGEMGERGEYMDGYSKQAMIDRCKEDYKWTTFSLFENFATERAELMSHLYDNERLWEHVSMVAFAEHYVLGEETSKPFDTFQRQKDLQASIFSGVVLSDWQAYDDDGMEQKLQAFKEKGIDYVRLECNFGSADDIGGPAQLADNARFSQLAEAAKKCQKQEMVPLVLIQVPWRESGDCSNDYFEQAVKSFAGALKNARVESKRVILETRPPIGVSAREERGLRGTTRISLGLETGQKMFEAIDEAFDGDKIAGFCVAGGSTKGDLPTAMEDDTQNAVRQGMRRCAQQQWGYELCFWEMGAKLMLQPKVGRLWRTGRDAARELFLLNAHDLADEIKEDIPDL